MRQLVGLPPSAYCGVYLGRVVTKHFLVKVAYPYMKESGQIGGKVT